MKDGLPELINGFSGGVARDKPVAIAKMKLYFTRIETITGDY